MLATSPAPMPIQAHDCSQLSAALSQILQEIRDLLKALSFEDYAAKSTDLFAKSSIGGHVRHCLDHARAVVNGWDSGIVDYDHRARGTCIESDIHAADAELCRVIAGVQRMSATNSTDPIRVAIMPTRDGQPVTLLSTVARELAFVLSHTIHHNATIRGIAISRGHGVSSSFGCAPSTLAHQDAMEKCQCAR